ncbi:MAG TPA: hypothetical protein VLA88_02755 [Candidatus Saccharimonadales bacterium]|nr:hypothetical protein [Candidatus Saccharimonadales bacterium]
MRQNSFFLPASNSRLHVLTGAPGGDDDSNGHLDHTPNPTAV